MKAGSLFSGVGGLDLGLELAGMEVAWQVESDKFCRRVLKARWPEVRRYGDVAAVDWEDVERVDIIAGGFPCQDISNAHTSGQRRSLEGRQSGLWSHFLAVVAALEPEWAVVENVAAFGRWVPAVRSDLAHLGYASVPVELSAGSFGAPHVRPRIFVVAHADSDGEPLRALDAQVARIRPLPVGGGYWRAPPPGGFRVDDGVPDGMDRCRVVGNAVVPPVAEWVARRIMEAA